MNERTNLICIMAKKVESAAKDLRVNVEAKTVEVINRSVRMDDGSSKTFTRMLDYSDCSMEQILASAAKNDIVDLRTRDGFKDDPEGFMGDGPLNMADYAAQFDPAVQKAKRQAAKKREAFESQTAEARLVDLVATLHFEGIDAETIATVRKVPVEKVQSIIDSLDV